MSVLSSYYNLTRLTGNWAPEGLLIPVSIFATFRFIFVFNFITVIIKYKIYNRFIVGHFITMLDKVVKHDRHKEKPRRAYELF